jgi:succinylglutamic semialdehyde dehydrogenase
MMPQTLSDQPGHSAGGSSKIFRSINPATGETVWEGTEASDIYASVQRARDAAAEWTATPLEHRIAILQAFAYALRADRLNLAEAISREVGKPRWEALTEVDAMIGKVPVSIQAYYERRRETEAESAGVKTATRFKPHGVVAVLGPFNFPGHLPNGHIVPALLAGNTVLFKPSELAPLVAERTVALWYNAGLPPGVLQLLQGGATVGQALVQHTGVDGIFFTGSSHVGKSMRRVLADHPEKILALEMGGNNPLVVHQAGNIAAAVYNTIQSAYITAGQRCTCSRRLIVPIGPDGDAFIAALVAAVGKIRVGPFTDDPQPFMGPVISDTAANRLLTAQANLGGEMLVQMRSIGPRRAMLSPGLIDITHVPQRSDTELFGPLLQLVWATDFDAAIAEANRTAYGLSAGLLSDDRALYQKFYQHIRAGIVNWNRPITGASGSLPFGGIGASGNHRPSGYYAADYCSYPVASMESDRLELPAVMTPGVLV